MKRKFLLTPIAVMTAIHSVAATTFVIGTYNIRLRTLSDKTDDPATDKYWDNRCDNVAQTIRDGAFDILAINEMTDDASTDGRTMFADMQGYFPAPEYAFVTQPGAKNTLAAILYRTELFEVLEKGSFWLGPDPYNYSTDVWDHGNFGRMSLWAKFRVKTTGEVFFVMVTHLHHQGNISKNEGSAQNVDAMRAIAGGCPAFICGDHNSTASREPFYKLYGAYFDDSYVVAAHTDGSGGTCNVWNSTSLSRLDYVWVRGAVVNDYSTIQNKYDKDFYPSDHFPVRAEVSLCPPVEVRVRYVDASAADGGIGSIDAPFKLLQDAIDASGRGDTILVAEGSYFPTFVPSTTNAKATFNIERSLTIIGGYDSDFASVCGRSVLSGDLDGNDIVSADDATNVVTIGSSASVEMANIEVCGGVAKAQKGAGIQCNGPRLVLENVYVHDNSSNNMGGGVYAYGQIKAHGCVFERNVTTANGGAVYVDTNGSSMPWSHRFDGCRFSGNKALGGAAICVQSTMWLSVINNCFDSNVSTARGALTVTGNKTYSTVSITNNTFANNVLASANTSGNASKGGAAIYMQNLLDVASDDTPKASVAIASNTIVGNVCRYVDGVDVPDDFNAAAVNVLTDVSLYLNNNIIVGNSAPKEVADVYLTVPECVESSNTKYGIYSHSGSVNFALQPTDYCCSSADEALQCVVHALDGTVDDGVFTANLTLDGSVAPVVRIVNPVFGQKALNSLASPRFRENVVMADFNGDCQIVKATTYDRDQRGALRNMSGSASYGAFEYEAAGADAIKVVADDENAPTEYFDIRGWRVSPDNLQPGIYIRRCGSKTDKIIVSGR